MIDTVPFGLIRWQEGRSGTRETVSHGCCQWQPVWHCPAVTLPLALLLGVHVPRAALDSSLSCCGVTYGCQEGVLAEEALIFHLNIYLLIRFFFLLLQLYSYSSQKTCKDEKVEGSKCSLLITKDGINWVIPENFECQCWMMSLSQNQRFVGNAYKVMLLLKPESTVQACHACQSTQVTNMTGVSKNTLKTVVRNIIISETHCAIIYWNFSLFFCLWRFGQTGVRKSYFKLYNVEANYNAKFKDLLQVLNIFVLDRHLKGLEGRGFHHSVHITWFLAKKIHLISIKEIYLLK